MKGMLFEPSRAHNPKNDFGKGRLPLRFGGTHKGYSFQALSAHSGSQRKLAVFFYHIRVLATHS